MSDVFIRPRGVHEGPWCVRRRVAERLLPVSLCCSEFGIVAVPVAFDPTETRSPHPDLPKEKTARTSDRFRVAGQRGDLARLRVELEFDGHPHALVGVVGDELEG